MSQQGNDSNIGTSWASPWKSLQYASNKAFAGDTVIIRKGKSYYPGFIVTNNGKDGKPITFTGENDKEPPIMSGATKQTRWQKHKKGIWKATTSAKPNVITEDNHALPPATSGNLDDGNWFWDKNTVFYRPSSGKPDNHEVWRTSRGGGIIAKNKKWIVIKNIKCWQGGGSCISLDNSHNNSIKNVSAYFYWHGIDITKGSTNNIVENCHVERNQSGIYIRLSSSHNIIRNCKAVHNGNFPTWSTNDRAGIDIGERGPNISNTIEHCEIAYNGGPNSDPGLIAYHAPYSQLINNHVHDNYGSGVFVTINSHHSKVINNTVENNGYLATQSGFKGIAGLSVRHGSKGTLVQDNTIANNHVSSDSRWKGKDLGYKGGLDIRGLRGRDDMTDIVIKNNTVTGTKGGPDIYMDSNIDLTGMVIEPKSQAPWWHKESLTNK